MLVGFGCSFTYGSELIDPDLMDYYDPTSQTLVWDRHHLNTPHREKHCWLGQLAKYYNCDFDNRAQPANSNFAIAQQVADYFLNDRDVSKEIVICVGWTERTRMSWFDGEWVHNGFAGEQKGFHASAKEWVITCSDRTHDLFTENAKLIVNNICSSHGVPILQFNALGKHKSNSYPNYFLGSGTMDGLLKREGDEKQKDFFALGGHPNELGQEYFTKRLYNFAKERIIL